ncbi:MAG: trypsin-like peptidase domain-containing protein [Bacteroidota bacterium]
MKKTVFLAVVALITMQLTAQDWAGLFETHKRSVVTIYTAETVNAGTGDPRTFASSMGLGSGVLVRNNMVLTAAHVVGNAEEIMVQFYDGEAIPAKTIRMNRMVDVALIKLDKAPGDPHVATMGNSDETKTGERVFIIGAPMGLPFSLSTGVISGRHAKSDMVTEGYPVEFFQTDASINTGNSGGPMFNSKGEVIGIVSSILSRSGGFEGIGFAATSEIAQAVLTSKGSKYFGIDSVVLPYELARILNVPQESGLMVQHVVKNSPAGAAGVKGGFRKININDRELLLGGDIILAVDHVKITGIESLTPLYKHLEEAGNTARHKLSVLRAGEIIELYWVASDFY